MFFALARTHVSSRLEGPLISLRLGLFLFLSRLLSSSRVASTLPGASLRSGNEFIGDEIAHAGRLRVLPEGIKIGSSPSRTDWDSDNGNSRHDRFTRGASAFWNIRTRARWIIISNWIFFPTNVHSRHCEEGYLFSCMSNSFRAPQLVTVYLSSR